MMQDENKVPTSFERLCNQIQNSEEVQFVFKAMMLEEELYAHLLQGQPRFEAPEPSVVLELLRCALKDELYDALKCCLFRAHYGANDDK